jgi:flagellar motor switch protein FliG
MAPPHPRPRGQVVRVVAWRSTALEKADPQQLSKFILSEHPQTIALILAHLKPAKAAQLLNSCPRTCAWT